VETPGARCQLAFPIRIGDQVRGVVGAELEMRTETQLRAAMRDLQWGSGWLESLLRRHADPREAGRAKLKLALDLVAGLLEQKGLNDSASAFVTELATRLGCDRVALGTLARGRVTIRAMSHSGHFDHRANLLQAMEQAMEEAIDQRQSVVYPQQSDSPPVVSIAHMQLTRESGAGSAATFPLAMNGRLVGALTLERAAGAGFDAPSVELCEAVAAVSGPIVELKRMAERGLVAQISERAQDLQERLIGPGDAGLKLATVAAAAAALFLAFATGSYRVSAESTVEGQVQRAISAPINGFIKEASRRAGDTVREGEVIGRFDDRDLKLERVKLLGQAGQYSKQYREAMANHNRALAAIVSAQLEQAQAQLALVEEQLSRTEMVAPFDGFIISGDLSQKLGSPVERGQVLFEVAPLDGFRIALNVDERDFGDVVIGQRGELAVTSIPEARYPFVVTRITAVNVAKEGRNTFRVEASVDGNPGRLRPGMEGIGKIYVDERRRIWIWTHSLTDWVRLWLWSALP
jgi:biotin carboxyl carrier protein